MASTTRVIAVECLGETQEKSDSGILDSRFVLFSEMDDDLLEMLFEQSPDLIMEKRPDFVQRRFPKSVN